MRTKTVLLKFSLLAVFVITKVSFANELRLYTDQVPTAAELADTLFPDQSSGSQDYVKTRSITFGSKKKTSDADPVGIGMPIHFDYASYYIREESRPFLDQIGLMLNLEKLTDKKIVIEGHTDALGPSGYNERLSQQRAQSVKRYLMSNYNIRSERLLVSGKGERELLPGKSANDPLNRRVQFYPAQ